MGTSEEAIEHKTKSAKILKEKVKKAITGVFTKNLECVEIRFGDEFDGYEHLRAKFLRVGNDAIRILGKVIDSEFNVECKSLNLHTIKFK